MQRNYLSTAVIQLNDIHVRDSTKFELLSDRARSIATKVATVIPNETSAVLVYNGDIAFSGKSSEYAIFQEHFHNVLVQKLQSELVVVRGSYATPGNHDLDFAELDENRVNMLRLKDPGRSLTQTGYTNATSPLKAFIEGMRNSNISTIDPMGSSTVYCIDSEHGISIALINTSLFCTDKDEYGGLRFPCDDLVSELSSGLEGTKVAIAAMHHSLSWIEPESARTVRSVLNETFGVVMTGHEHQQAEITMQLNAGSDTHFLETGPLIEDGKYESSRFNVMILGSADCTVTIHPIKFDGTRVQYVAESNSRTLTLSGVRSKLLRNALHMTETSRRRLTDTGSPIRHPRKDTLSLDDIFIVPNICYVDETKTDDEQQIDAVEGVELDCILDDTVAVVSGEPHSGKSALLRKLSQQYYDVGYYPIWLDVGELVQENRSLTQIVSSLFNDSFCVNGLDSPYDSVNKRSVVVVIDDFHKAAQKQTILSRRLSELKSLVGKILLSVDNSIFSASFERRILSTIGSYCKYELRELRISHVRELAKMWSRIGSMNDTELEQAVRENRNIVEQLYNSRVIPRHAFYFLAALSLNTTRLGDNGSSYVSIYEILIGDLLMQQFKHPSVVALYQDIVAQLAFRIVDREVPEFTRSDVEEVVRDHTAKTGAEVDISRLLSGLVAGRVVDGVDENYRFHYRYTFYYFVACYLEANSSDEAVKKFLGNYFDAIQSERNTVVLSFYLQKSGGLEDIDRLMEIASGLFSLFQEFDVDSDVRSTLAAVESVYVRGDHQIATSVESSALDEFEDEHHIAMEYEELVRAINIIDILTSVCRSKIGVFAKDSGEVSSLTDERYRTLSDVVWPASALACIRGTS